MPETRARELLEMDVEINAQGLEVWLDRQRGLIGRSVRDERASP
jgi:hypothetical protein